MIKIKRIIGLILIAALLTPNVSIKAYASTYDSVTGTAFDTVDDAGYGETSYAIRFGSTLQKELSYSSTLSRFIFTAGIKVIGSISGSSLKIDNNADVFGRLNVSGSVLTKGTLSGKTLIVSGASSFSGAVTFKTGIISKGALSGTTLRVSGPADIHGPLTASGSFRTDSDITINDDNDTNDAVLTFGNQTAAQTIKFLNTNQKFRFSKAVSVFGNISGSTLTVDNNATVSGSLFVKNSTMIGGGAFLPNSPLHIGGNVNNYLQANIQNTSNGALGSSDWIATADTGNDTTNYVDIGINGSGYNDPTFTITTALDSYAYANGGNFAIGTQSANTAVKFFTAGTLAANERMRIDSNGNVGIGLTNPLARLEVDGTVSGSNLVVANRATISGSLAVRNSISGATLRVGGPADIHGALTASGAIRTDSNITINDDADSNDAVLTFGNTSGNQTLKYLNANQRFDFSANLNVLGSISGRTLVISGASSFSGSSLFRTNLAVKGTLSGTSFFGAGLGDCTGATTQKLLYNSTTGKFSCGTDQGGAGGGISFATASGVFVNQAGDTMTGMLAIQNGTIHTATLTPLLQVRGTMSGRSLQITGTGAATHPLFFTDVSKGFVGIGTNTPSKLLTISGGTILQIPGGTPSTMSGIDFYNTVNAVFVSGNHLYVGENTTTGQNFRSVDISDPSNPAIIGGYSAGANIKSIFVSTKHAFIGLSGASAGSGLLILDNTNPGAQFLVGRYNFGANVNSIYVSGKYIYAVSDSVTGPCSATLGYTGCEFRIIDFTNVVAPVVVGGLDLAATANVVYVQNRYAYIGKAAGGNNFIVVDLNKPYDPQNVGGITYATAVQSLYVSGKYVYAGLAVDGSNPELRVIDVTVKSAPVTAGSLEISSTVNSIYVSGDWARLGLASGPGDDYWTVDMRNPKTPKKVGGVDFGTDVNSLIVAGKYAYVGLTSVTGNDMRIIDLNGFETPAASIGSTFTSQLFVSDNVRIDNNMYVRNAANIGRGGIISKGPVSVQSMGSGATTNALEVRNSTGRLLMQVVDDGTFAGTTFARFGAGSGGNVNGNTTTTAANSTTTLTGSMYYRNLTVTANSRIVTAGYKIYVSGTLTVNGIITGTGSFGGNGSSPTTAGAAGAAIAAADICGGGAGSAGGAGATAIGTAGTAGVAATNSITRINQSQTVEGGAGGAGGAATSAGGAGGASGALTTPRMLFTLVENTFFATAGTWTIYFGGSGGAGGGGGGGDAVNSGGGGAGGGGGARCGMIFAKNIIVNAGGVITFAGGKGGTGGNGTAGNTGGGGGGSGGGGGWLQLVYASLVNNGTISVAGGVGGNGGTGFGTGVAGKVGNTGKPGVLLKFNVAKGTYE